MVLHCTLTAKSLLANVLLFPIVTVALHLYIPECLLSTLLILMLLPMANVESMNLSSPPLALNLHTIEHAGLLSALQETGPNFEPSVTLIVLPDGLIIAADGPSIQIYIFLLIFYDNDLSNVV